MNNTSVLVTCAQCGAVGGETVPLDWALSTERGRTSAYCARCARENVRAIEARLDGVHW